MTAPPVDIGDPCGPHAEVTRLGRWWWRVAIHDGLMVYGPGGWGWRVFGRDRAERKARRELRRYLLNAERKSKPIEIWPRTPGKDPSHDQHLRPLYPH